ncbi:FAD-dependent oxidoreductase [Gallaecimonas mangrovi]|uniref:FAD-dependent oxidoreductase n=1 Tax=Gallaecimonas mangrovi TaxID=2291597 RepID=UPI000E1FD37F|nr:FAD-dependent oxidoreductase [Gallaecimonas mangrovi]
MANAASFTPIKADPKAIFTINACTRPFRLTGPRLELEKRGPLNLIHNYGHGGSGWSLSWGAAAQAVTLAKATGATSLAVVGCGAIGITTAIAAQQAGFQVSIYAKAALPGANSAFATGIWSPDSRIVAKPYASDFAPRWEQMARYAFARFVSLLDEPSKPVQWLPVYNLSSHPFGESSRHALPGEPEYPHFEQQLLTDLTPQPEDLVAGSTPFAHLHVRRERLLMFNLSQYADYLMQQFKEGGGQVIYAELQSGEDFAALGHGTVINCTGFGAKALLGDQQLVPVRGQTCRLPAQAAVHYGIRDWDTGIAAYPRRDGLLVQAQAATDFNNPDASIVEAESVTAVKHLAHLAASMRR